MFWIIYSCCDVSTWWKLVWPFWGKRIMSGYLAAICSLRRIGLPWSHWKHQCRLSQTSKDYHVNFFSSWDPSRILRLEISLGEFPLLCCCWSRSPSGIPRFDKMAKQCKWSRRDGKLPFPPNSGFKRKYLSTEATLKLGGRDNSTGWRQWSVYMYIYININVYIYIYCWAPIRLKTWKPPDRPKAFISGARQGVMSGAWHGIGISLELPIVGNHFLGSHCIESSTPSYPWLDVSLSLMGLHFGVMRIPDSYRQLPTVADSYRQWKTWCKTWCFFPADWAPPRAPLKQSAVLLWDQLFSNFHFHQRGSEVSKCHKTLPSKWWLSGGFPEKNQLGEVFYFAYPDMVPAIQWRRRLAPMVKGRDLGEGGFVLKIRWFGIFSMATSESKYSSSWNHGWRKWVSLKKLVFV